MATTIDLSRTVPFQSSQSCGGAHSRETLVGIGGDMKTLTEAEYLATMGTPMTRRAADAEPPFEFWSYFDALPVEEHAGHDFSEGEVDCARRAPSRENERARKTNARKTGRSSIVR